MPGRPISFGSRELDPDAAILRRAGERCTLQSQPLRLLALLVERHGQVVTREEIEQLWSDTVVEYDLGINFAIRQIRIALGSDRAPGLVLAVIGTLAVGVRVRHRELRLAEWPAAPPTGSESPGRSNAQQKIVAHEALSRAAGGPK